MKPNVAKIVFGETNVDNLKKMSLSDSTVKHIIDALLQDIKIQSSKRNYCYEL
jgi:hypothetical protein